MLVDNRHVAGNRFRNLFCILMAYTSIGMVSGLLVGLSIVYDNTSSHRNQALLKSVAYGAVGGFGMGCLISIAMFAYSKLCTAVHGRDYARV